MRLQSLLAGLTAANGHGGISIPGNENLRPETFGRMGPQLARETTDWRLQTEFPAPSRGKVGLFWTPGNYASSVRLGGGGRSPAEPVSMQEQRVRFPW